MSHRINVILDDSAWSALQEIPAGERSKLISRAIEEKVSAIRRLRAAQKMDEFRKELPAVSEAELVSWLRSDRNR